MVEKLKRFSARSNLSIRLLFLTILFVLLAEILIYVPSIANFRQSWLEERLLAANIAVLAIEAAPDYMISEMLTKELLDKAQVVAVSLKRPDKRQLVLNTDLPLDITAQYDLRDASYWVLVRDALKSLFHSHPHGSLIQVTGNSALTPHDTDSSIQIVFPENLLCDEMYAFSRNVVLLSIIISLITAGLVYYSLSCLLIRPVQRMTRSIISFRAAPEVATDDLTAEGRKDEIGIIMREIGDMQNEVRRALTQKNHLAKLGEAVAKINHDLRNILSSAQLVSENLSTIDNAVVQKLTPRFVTALDRAIRLCENTLKYGKTGAEKPILTPVELKHTADEVAISLGLAELNSLTFTNDIPEKFIVNADADQIFRVFLNLSRNALQSMKDRGQLTIKARHEQGNAIIDILDTGPGIAKQMRKKLFQPFQASGNGGTGLGLAISKEIIEAHGGTLNLISSTAKGTHFQFTLPG